MDYLTQHYKNLAEQLQEKVNHLKQLIEQEETHVINQVINDSEAIQKANVKKSKKAEQDDRVLDSAVKGTSSQVAEMIAADVMGPVITKPLGAGLLGTAGYGAGKVLQAGIDFLDPEQKTYAKIGSALTGGPEKVERRGAPATQEDYSNAAKTAAAARKARYGSNPYQARSGSDD
jgi:hypothetical protein